MYVGATDAPKMSLEDYLSLSQVSRLVSVQSVQKT